MQCGQAGFFTWMVNELGCDPTSRDRKGAGWRCRCRSWIPLSCGRGLYARGSSGATDGRNLARLPRSEPRVQTQVHAVEKQVGTVVDAVAGARDGTVTLKAAQVHLVGGQG